MSALAILERFGEKDAFFKKCKSCRHCLQSEWALPLNRCQKVNNSDNHFPKENYQEKELSTISSLYVFLIFLYSVKQHHLSSGVVRLGNIFMTFLMFSFSKLLKTKNKQIHIGQKKMNKKISFPQLKKHIKYY